MQLGGENQKNNTKTHLFDNKNEYLNK
jgi:hypothetical protein